LFPRQFAAKTLIWGGFLDSLALARHKHAARGIGFRLDRSFCVSAT
jgi:hypothetical protein